MLMDFLIFSSRMIEETGDRLFCGLCLCYNVFMWVNVDDVLSQAAGPDLLVCWSCVCACIHTHFFSGIKNVRPVPFYHFLIHYMFSTQAFVEILQVVADVRVSNFRL